MELNQEIIDDFIEENILINEYYIYVYYTPDGIPFYVGKGCKDRMYRHLYEAKNFKKLLKQNVNLNFDKIKMIHKIWNNKQEPIIEKIAENLTKEETFELEIKYIKLFGRKDKNEGTLMNKTDGGDGGTGRIISEEERLKMSERISGINNPMYGVPSIWKGKKLPDKTRAKISKKAKERKYSEETKAKMSNSHLGEKNSMYNKKHTENTKKKISETRQKYIGENHPMYGKKHSEESKKRISKKASKIKIKQLDKGGNLIKIWSSMTEAYKILSSNGYKISVTTISKCCKGKVKTAGGFCWQYY